MRLLVLLAVPLMAVSLPTNPAFHPAFLPLPANQPTAPGAERSCRTTRNFRMVRFGPAPGRLVSTPGLSTSPHVPAAGKESLVMVSTAQQNSGAGARFLPGAGRLPRQAGSRRCPDWGHEGMHTYATAAAEGSPAGLSGKAA